MYTPHDSPSSRAHTEQQPQPGALTSSMQGGREDGQVARRSGVHCGQRKRTSLLIGAHRAARKSSRWLESCILFGGGGLARMRWQVLPLLVKGSGVPPFCWSCQRFLLPSAQVIYYCSSLKDLLSFTKRSTARL